MMAAALGTSNVAELTRKAITTVKELQETLSPNPFIRVSGTREFSLDQRKDYSLTRRVVDQRMWYERKRFQTSEPREGGFGSHPSHMPQAYFHDAAALEIIDKRL
jgi:hypothetical protein